MYSGWSNQSSFGHLVDLDQDVDNRPGRDVSLCSSRRMAVVYLPGKRDPNQDIELNGSKTECDMIELARIL
jgi:hypothetical protein